MSSIILWSNTGWLSCSCMRRRNRTALHGRAQSSTHVCRLSHSPTTPERALGHGEVHFPPQQLAPQPHSVPVGGHQGHAPAHCQGVETGCQGVETGKLGLPRCRGQRYRWGPSRHGRSDAAVALRVFTLGVLAHSEDHLRKRHPRVMLVQEYHMFSLPARPCQERAAVSSLCHLRVAPHHFPPHGL
jgi:hypothetical protein